MMAKHCFIGIDTSNYTTSLALANADGEVIANLKEPLPVKEGERGLRQSDAVFHHVRNLPVLFERAKPYFDRYSPVAVGVSTRPRDAEGSYMPCFLSGRAVASAIAATHGIPLYEFSHQNGHIMAACYSAGRELRSEEHPFLHRPFGAFHVSGGTTEILYVEPKETNFSISLVGETADLNAGQLIDRIGVKMGFQFPAGPMMEAYASSYTGKIPKAKIAVNGTVCHLSGLENLAERLFLETGDIAQVSAYVLSAVGETLSALTENLLARYPDIPVLYAGGVMSNRILQRMLGDRFQAYFSEPAFSADNAAGIALLCKNRYQNENPLI